MRAVPPPSTGYDVHTSAAGRRNALSSPLAGRRWRWGWLRRHRDVRFCTTPTPGPSPQGGGETRSVSEACRRTIPMCESASLRGRGSARVTGGAGLPVEPLPRHSSAGERGLGGAGQRRLGQGHRGGGERQGGQEQAGGGGAGPGARQAEGVAAGGARQVRHRVASSG